MSSVSVNIVAVRGQVSLNRRLSETRSGERTLEADGIQLLNRVVGGEQTGTVTETEKKERDNLSRLTN